jgi:hypothetical protein
MVAIGNELCFNSERREAGRRRGASGFDAALYRFLVEMQFGIHVSLHRDVMGLAFKPTELRFSYAAPLAAQRYRDAFSCDALFGQPSNEMAFDATLLDAVPPLGDRLTNPTVLKMCDKLLEEFDLRKGLSGKVREALLVNFFAIGRRAPAASRGQYPALRPRAADRGNRPFWDARPSAA